MSDRVNSDETSASDHAVRREGDRRRAAKLRERRGEAGQVRISAWVPRERASYARQLLHAAVAGANSLPSDPEQAAALDAANAEATAARAAEATARAAGAVALADAEQRRQALAAELDAARADTKAAHEAGRRAEAAAAAQAEMAERAREAIAGELRAAEAAAAQAQAEAERFRQAPGLRGRVVRWLVR